MIFKDSKLYDFLKTLALVVLPPLEAFVIGLGEVWGIPSMAKVGATIALFATFLGAILVNSSKVFQRATSIQTTFNDETSEAMRGVDVDED